MTRDEQRKRAAQQYAEGEPDGAQKIVKMVSFEFGAIWADKFPDKEYIKREKKRWIENACDWIYMNDSYAKPTEIIVKRFREAMEAEDVES